MAEIDVERVHSQHAVLDIGDGVGALVLYTSPELCGREIEVSPIGRPAQRVHTAILERRANGRTIFAGVYRELPAGDYTIWWNETTPAGEVAIVAGSVAEVDWRGITADSRVRGGTQAFGHSAAVSRH